MKKQILLSLLFLPLSIITFAQVDFAQVDKYARQYKASTKDLKQFTTGLTAPFSSEKEKARAIFTWIADNISYDCRKYHKNVKKNKPTKIRYKSQAERAKILADIKAKKLGKTLKKKKGVCEDYAGLFQEMCHIAGIEAVFISGFARTHPQQVGEIPHSSTHAWNAIKIDDAWYLVDVTFASGGANANCKKFRKSFKGAFFMVKPEDMITSHLPDKEEWQYLATPVSKKEFSEIPFTGYGYLKYKVSDYSHKKAFIDAADKLTFRIKFEKELEGQLRFLVNNKKVPINIRKTDDGYVEFDYNNKKKKHKTLSIAISENKKLLHVLTYKTK